MPDNPSKIRWDAENVIKVGLKINRNQGPELFTLLAKAENKTVELNNSSPFISEYQKTGYPSGYYLCRRHRKGLVALRSCRHRAGGNQLPTGQLN